VAFSKPIIEVRTTGSDTLNSGVFDVGQSAGMRTTGATTGANGNTASPVFHDANYTFVAGDVGASVYIAAGTNAITGWFPIASVASGDATLSAAVGAGAKYVSGSVGPTTASDGAGIATVASPTALTWSIDYSQQAAAQIAFSDLVVQSTTTQGISAGNPLGKQMVGNSVNVTSGGTVQTVVLTSVTGTTGTFDKSLGTAAQTCVGGMGGCLKSPALADSFVVAPTIIFYKAGTYLVTSSASNAANGCIVPATNGTTTARNQRVGYGVVRGDVGTRPLVQASGTPGACTLYSCIIGRLYNSVSNVNFDAAGVTSVIAGACGGTGSFAEYCQFLNTAGGTNFTLTANGEADFLEISGQTGAGNGFVVSGGFVFGCWSHANAGPGFNVNATASLSDCISSSNTGASGYGFELGTSNVFGHNLTAYGNSKDGFFTPVGGGPNARLWNCIASQNTGIGYNPGTLMHSMQLHNCDAYSNTGGNLPSGAANQPIVNVGFQTLGSDPFVNAAGNNFGLVAGVSRASGLPGVFPGGSSTGYRDRGAIQHADPATTAPNEGIRTGGKL
jgi:hypothetical protein